MTEVKRLLRMEPRARCLSSACRYLDYLRVIFSSVPSDEIWVVSVQYLPPVNHNYSQDYFYSHRTGEEEKGFVH